MQWIPCSCTLLTRYIISFADSWITALTAWIVILFAAVTSEEGERERKRGELIDKRKHYPSVPPSRINRREYMMCQEMMNIRVSCKRYNPDRRS